MNLLVVSQYYYPEQFRVNDLCERLAEKGHSVTVLTGLPNYPEGEVYEGYKDKVNSVETINGVKVHRCKLLPRGKTKKELALNFLSFAYYGRRYIKRLNKQFDAVFVYQMSPITMGIPAIVQKRKKGTPLVLYCLDLWPASVLDYGIKRGSLIYNCLKHLSASIYRRCDKIIISSPSFSEYIIKLCNYEREKIEYIPQHAEELYIRTNIKNESDIVNFMYLGNIGHSQNCESIVEAVRRIQGKAKFIMHFVGSGSKLEELKERVKEYNLNEVVVFHGFQKLENLQKYYDIADVCILTLSDEYEIGLTIPAKLQGYMSVGKPVVASVSGDAAMVINEAKCGYCVKPGDIKGLAEAMMRMIYEKEKLQMMGESGYKYFKENFSTNAVISKIEKAIESVVNHESSID